MTKKQKRNLIRIILTAVIFIPLFIVYKVTDEFSFIPENLERLKMLFFIAPYILIGYDVIAKAFRNISHGQVFDECFLMMIATFGAFGVAEYEEAVAVMLFYQVGELFQDYAVGKSRKSISDMMNIVPEYANLLQDGELCEVDPDEVEVGSIIVIKPGEKVPLDGVVIEGESLLDTAALTGESVPRSARVGDEIYSGCVNTSGTIKVRTTKEFDDSTVAKVLEMVENAGEKKAKVENFITRFAKYYTPIVTIAALLVALLPPVFIGLSCGNWSGDTWISWITTACTLLVVSCPCALVISVPMGFFGGIGAASRIGVLVKGANYLEAVSELTTVVFDKTGTLTKGEFKVTQIIPSVHALADCGDQADLAKNNVLRLAAYGEGYSNHPIAESIREAYAQTLDLALLSEAEEISGHGTILRFEGRKLLVGNAKLLEREQVEYTPCECPGTVVYVAFDGRFMGTVVISDSIKEGAKEALLLMKQEGITQTVMLTGDRRPVAEAVAAELSVDTVYAELLPGDKVSRVEELLAKKQGKEKLAFVGDGINDAPVLTRADVGFAMGSMGSDAAIEAADVVIMDDDVRKISSIIRIARKTLKIVRQNIVFALGVKGIVLVFGILSSIIPSFFLGANMIMWFAVFADVGVCTLAILNSMRTLKGRL